MVKDIQMAAFSHEAHVQKDVDTEEQESMNHVCFLQLVEVYKTLKYAIKHADIGLIRRVVNTYCVLFEGSKQYKYAREMMFLKRLISTNACKSPLQKAILANSLVNLQGKPDTWFEIDLFNEHLNYNLKELIYT